MANVTISNNVIGTIKKIGNTKLIGRVGVAEVLIILGIIGLMFKLL